MIRRRGVQLAKPSPMMMAIRIGLENFSAL